jgi:predicted esterase
MQNSRRVRIAFAVSLVLTMSAAFCAFEEPQKHELPDGKGLCMIVLPKGHDPKKSYDLIVALHGAGDTAENFARCWSTWAGNRESILAVPEASQKAGPGYTWSTPDEAKIAAVVEDCIKTYGADRKRVMLTGHSAGCAIGFFVVSKHPDMFACYGGTAQVVEQFVNKKELEKAVPTTAIYFAIGKQDPNHAFYKDTLDLLTKMKFNIVTEDPDIGHTVTPEECKKMLDLFDSTADKIGQQRLADAKKQLAAKSWGAAENALAAVASGKGPSATEAATLLENLKKEFITKLDAAKALKGPDAVEAYQKIEKEYPGTTVAAEAHTLAEQVSKDPATKEIADTRRHEALEAKALQALKDAEALETAGKFIPALDAYERMVKDFAESTLKPKAQAAVERLKKDPRLVSAKNSGEAEKLLKRADNFLRNGANDEAKEILSEVIQKFPDTDAAKQAKSKVSLLK